MIQNAEIVGENINNMNFTAYICKIYWIFLNCGARKRRVKRQGIIFGIFLIRCIQDLGDLNNIRSASIQPDIRTQL